MSIIECLNLKKNVIKHLTRKGYIYQDDEKILFLRSSLTEVILLANLKTAITSLNSSISSRTLNNAIFKIKKIRQTSLEVVNKQAHELLINGVKVENSVTKRTETIKIVDFEVPTNNEFIITKQFKMVSDHPKYEHQVLDLVIYLNGLPIVVFELKSPTHDDEEIIPKAFQQIKNYQKYLSSLFVFNVFNVISNKHVNKYGTITADFDQYFYWKQLVASSAQSDSFHDPVKEFIDLLFEQKTLLNLLKNYIFFPDLEPVTKIIATHHQYYGVQKGKTSVVKGIETNSQSQSKKGGIFWHTQGIGKIISIIMLAKNVIKIKTKITILVITDRNSLDEQISSFFTAAESYLGQKVKQIDSIKELFKELKGRVQNGVYLCTMQKFTRDIELLTARHNVLIIVENIQCSHWNIKGNESTLQKNCKEVTKKFGHAHYLHQAFPQATFVGFTTTPIETDDYATWKIFGDYVSKYLAMDAETDGYIVKINYEFRQKKLHLNLNDIDYIEKKFTKKTRKRRKIENIIADDGRITAIVQDFINHYQIRKNVLKSKAMFVAFNWKIALKYYHMIIKQAPELKSHLRVIMPPNLQTDKPEELKIIGSDKYRGESAIEFKKPNSDFKIAIVVDMWLTGFDVPCLDTIYIDKPIKKHNLIQTIAQVNWVYTDETNKKLVKESGLIVDYIGIWKKINKVLSFYGYNQDNLQGKPAYEADINKIKNILIQQVTSIYNSYLQSLTSFTCHQVEQEKDYAYDVIEQIQQVVIKNGCEQHFVQAVKPLSKWLRATLTILTSLDRIKIQILMFARSRLIKRELGWVDLDENVQYIKKIIEDTIKCNKPIPSYQPTINKISLSSIVNYIQRTDLQKNPHLVIKKIISAFSNLVQIVQKMNNIRGKKLFQNFKNLSKKYSKNHLPIYFKKFLKSSKELAEETLKIRNDAKKLDLTEFGLAIYEIIFTDEYSQNHYGQQMIKKITLEIVHKVQKLEININQKEEKKEILKVEFFFSLEKYYPLSSCQKLQKQLFLQSEDYIETNRIKIRDNDKMVVSNEFSK